MLRPKPRNYTASEQIIEYIGNCIFACGLTYGEIGEDTGLSHATIRNIAAGITSWPRPKTFFALLAYFNIELSLAGGVPNKRAVEAGKQRVLSRAHRPEGMALN
jgi:transcriptional regulator with XRE-family HTH domain